MLRRGCIDCEYLENFWPLDWREYDRKLHVHKHFVFLFFFFC